MFDKQIFPFFSSCSLDRKQQIILKLYPQYKQLILDACKNHSKQQQSKLFQALLQAKREQLDIREVLLKKLFLEKSGSALCHVKSLALLKKLGLYASYAALVNANPSVNLTTARREFQSTRFWKQNKTQQNIIPTSGKNEWLTTTEFFQAIIETKDPFFDPSINIQRAADSLKAILRPLSKHSLLDKDILASRYFLGNTLKKLLLMHVSHAWEITQNILSLREIIVESNCSEQQQESVYWAALFRYCQLLGSKTNLESNDVVSYLAQTIAETVPTDKLVDSEPKHHNHSSKSKSKIKTIMTVVAAATVLAAVI